MPTSKDDKSRNAFESDMAGTAARTHAEGKIEDLRLKGGLFVDAVRATRMAMAVTDPTLPGNLIVFANESFLRLSGYSMDEVLGQEPYFMNGPDTDPDDVARFEEALRNDQDDLVETIQYRRDGTRFIASVLLSAFKDDDGNTVHHFMSWLDVTRRTNAENRLNLLQRAQAALRESEKRLSATFEGVPVGVAAVGLDGTAIIANAEFRRFLPNETVPSRDPKRAKRWKAWDAEGRPVDPQDFPTSRALRGERVTPGQEMIYTDDDGREIWTNVATVPMFGDDGQVTGVVSTITDIDESKRAEDALRHSERRAESALRAAEMGTWDYDLVADVCHFDARARELYNLPSGQLDHRPEGVTSVVHPDDIGPMFDEIQRATDVNGSGRYDMIYRIAQADGKFHWLRAYGITEFEGSGEARRAVRIVGASRDITVERDAETALRESEQHQRLLLGELQHRVRNSLAVIRSIARRTADNTSSVEEMLAHFQGRIDAFSRVQAALTRTASAKVELMALVEDELLAHAVKENGNLLIEGPEILLDPRTAERLSLAIHELTTNAVKHGALGRDSGKILIRWQVEDGAEEGRQLNLVWRESGVGLASAKLKREGFGMELLRLSLPYDLHAETKVDLTPDGLHFDLTMPLPDGAEIETSNVEPVLAAD